MEIVKLDDLAKNIRKDIITVSYLHKVPHLGSCLSIVDILTVLYFKYLNISSDNLNSENRDRFILSKGHAVPALYQVLKAKSILTSDELKDYGSDGSYFAEHPPASGIDGIEAATGSLGHGLPIGLGISLSLDIKELDAKTVVLLGDGECNEGSVWEAAMMASSNKTKNLIAIIDFNKWQATDRSKEVLSLDPLSDKWESFGWEVYECDGNDTKSLIKVLDKIFNSDEKKPKVLIAHTVKGKGISFMEDDNNWHYRTPNKEEYENAMLEMEID